MLNKWSFQQDDTTDVEPTRKLRTLSGPGIVFYPLTATFVFVDWVLSLEPDWFSTMFLVLIVIGQMLTAIAFSIMLLAWLRQDQAVLGDRDGHSFPSSRDAAVRLYDALDLHGVRPVAHHLFRQSAARDRLVSRIGSPGIGRWSSGSCSSSILRFRSSFCCRGT